MRIIKRMLRQKCVYWHPTGEKDRFGEDIYEQPVELKCRWEDSKHKDIANNMEEVIFKSTVYVDRDVKEGGYLRFGKIEDMEGATVVPPDDANEIQKFERFPSLKANQFLRIVKL